MSEFVVEPWVNEIGQTINPGDQVVAVGTSYKSTKIMFGVFEGVRYGDVGRYEVVKDDNGEPVMEKNQWGSQRPKQQFVTSRQVVAVRVGQIPSRKWKYNYATKKGEYVDGFKTSTLPLRRVFKIDTPAAELSKVSF